MLANANKEYTNKECNKQRKQNNHVTCHVTKFSLVLVIIVYCQTILIPNVMMANT